MVARPGRSDPLDQDDGAVVGGGPPLAVMHRRLAHGGQDLGRRCIAMLADDLLRTLGNHEGLLVSPDGSLWADAEGCQGLRHYDGERWRRFLPDLCTGSSFVGPDGSLWSASNRGFL